MKNEELKKPTKQESKKAKTQDTAPKEKYQPNKLIIVLGIILIIVVIISLIVNLTNKDAPTNEPNIKDENEPIINTNEGITKTQEIDGLRFTETALISQNGESYLTTEVTNTNNIDYDLEEFHIIIKDKAGNYVISYQAANGDTINYLIGYVGETIKAGETKSIITTIDQVISYEAYTIEYKIIK